ncbi:MAG TPA: siderophore-interacting protein [Ramlibacter sp.]|nr:siderophore-interacting protein [Ramlibacter sp.]
MLHSPQTRRVERVRHDPRRREARIRRVEPVGPGFVALTFGGEAFADFVSLSFDDHVKLLLEEEGGTLARRDYTPRRFDPHAAELTIEFALHGEGPAADWARTARVGERAVIAGPRGSMIIPLDYDWHLLVGDASALPAVHRRLEELPAGARALVVLQVEPQDRRRFDSQAEVDLHWVDGEDALLATVQRLTLPAGEGFAWAAGEASQMARLRELLADKGLAKEAMRVSAYWKQGAAGDDTLAG